MRLDTGTKVQDRRSGTVYVIVSSAPRGFGFDPDTGDAPELGRHYVLEDPRGTAAK